MESRATRSQFAALTPLIRCLVVLAATLLSASAWAERLTLEVIPLQHRLVRDMIPILRPMLDPAGTLTGTSNQLIVRTTPENLYQLKQVIYSIDTQIKQLKISVTQDVNRVTQQRQDALSGHLRAGNFAAGVPDSGPVAGGELAIDTKAGAVRYDTASTTTRDDSNNLHFVVTMEGQPAFITTGQDVPYPYHDETITPYGASTSDGVDYQNVSSGVYVTPRLQGERVVLEVAPQLARLDPSSGAIETHRAGTTISGRLGEWLPLGGSQITEGAANSELLARTRRQGDNTYSVWVKVEEQP